MSDTDKCCTCGFEWIHGHYGSHSCSEVLRKELAATKRELAQARAECGIAHDQRMDESSRAKIAEERAEKAEARVAELEGLRITGTHFLSDFVGVAVNLPLGSEPTIGETLGQAMPAKEWGPYKLQPDGFYRLQAMPGGGK